MKTLNVDDKHLFGKNSTEYTEFNTQYYTPIECGGQCGVGQRSRPHWKNSSFLTDLSHLCKIDKDLSQLCKTSMPKHLHIDAILSFNMHLTCLTYVPKKQHNKKRGKTFFLGQSPKQRIKMAAKGSRKQKEVYTELNRCCYL